MRVAIVYALYRIMVNIKVCTDFELLEVKVPLIFLGTEGRTLFKFFYFD